MRSHSLLPHTADLKVLARGDTLAEAVEAAADALLEALTDTSKVAEDEAVGVTVREPDLERAVVAALGELIFLHETEGLVFRSFRVERLEEASGGWLVHGTARGEHIRGHVISKEVKAVTYNDLRVERDGKGWVVQIVFDL